MKLLDNEKTLNAGEGLSLEQICARGCRAHFVGHVEAGNAYFSQLKPEHGDVYIRANGFLSQLLSFSRNYDLALKLALEVARNCPGNYLAIHYLELVHSHRQEYEIAWQLHRSYNPTDDDEEGYAYQSACLLSALGRYAEAMVELERRLAGADARYRDKLWDDPELAHLWQALP
jgi:tetratricopeptide (TPR) repeat protein